MWSASPSHDDAVIILVDIERAFDSVPHHILANSLMDAGANEWLVACLGSLYRNGTLRHESGVMCPKTLFGVKQGCPLSPELFATVMAKAASMLRACGLRPVMYADDVALIVRRADVQNALSVLNGIFLHLGLTVSPQKTIIVDSSNCHQHTHLGHIIPISMNAQNFAISELKALVAFLDKQPLTYGLRIKLWNILAISRLCYRLQCFGADVTCLQQLLPLGRKFVTGVTGLPSYVTNKSLISPARRGFGMRLPVAEVWITVLSSIHRYSRVQPQAFTRPIPSTTRTSMHPWCVGERAAKALANLGNGCSTANVIWNPSPSHWTYSPPSFVPCPLPNNIEIPMGNIFTDGSLIDGKAGSAYVSYCGSVTTHDSRNLLG